MYLAGAIAFRQFKPVKGVKTKGGDKTTEIVGTDENVKEMIALCALQQQAAGDCKGMYDVWENWQDVFGFAWWEYETEESAKHAIENFLNTHDKHIMKLAKQLDGLELLTKEIEL